MPLPLSYPGLKCVLENLEAVKRAHVIARAPGLQKINKLIPLCLENFCIDYNELSINTLSIICYTEKVKYLMNGKTLSRQISESEEEKMKKLIKYYICGRSIIHVDSLDWCDSFQPNVNGVNLKFRIVPVEDLKKLNNQTVVFEGYNPSSIDIISLIKYHVETKQDIRTTFVILSYTKNLLGEMLREFESAFDEFQCDLDGVNDRFIPALPKFSIPINNKFKIQVYAIEVPGKYCPYKIIVKPVSRL
ncbi:hypothetical protein GCK72_007952 [Caenorhabditis remanei]|uniref:DUF38 domain-containing protein n=1 Tax=Caenorhabditis remanei TaxID=31234 RepID=A0A6A5HLH5_CAERE|nr:hypothetical protein GCK72_007952 [Caenorhabditis remanei]KAF1767991.1 hypothetical protein GCK72_007952 [Caenorhabditis remanei]